MHPSVVMKAPGMEVLKVPLTKSAEKVDGVSVWEWSGSAVDEGAAAAQWFSNYLGKPSRLVRFNDGRTLNPMNWRVISITNFRCDSLILKYDCIILKYSLVACISVHFTFLKLTNILTPCFLLKIFPVFLFRFPCHCTYHAFLRIEFSDGTNVPSQDSWLE